VFVLSIIGCDFTRAFDVHAQSAIVVLIL